MPDSDRPPLRWLFGAPERRRQAARYWIVHSLVGPLNMSLHYGLRLLPTDACSAIGAALGAFARFRLPKKNANARTLWVRVRPQDADTADTAMRRLWRNVGRSMAEFSVLDRLWDEGRITVVGRENIDAAAATGKPMIGLALHLGNWETVAVAMLRMGFKGASIYMPPDNRFDHVIANLARRRIQGTTLKARPNAAAEAVVLMRKKKENLLLYADELARGRVWGPHFGRTLRREGNIGNAVRLARLANAVIVPMYSVRLDHGANFRVTILPALKLIDTGDPEADLMANIAMIDALIEPIVREHLDQWFFALDFEFD